MTTISTTTFCDRLYAAALPIWEAQLEHPFVKALGDGTLPRETFAYYIRQDARYLDDFAKTFAYAATRTSDHDEMQSFGDRLIHTIAVEKALHQEYAARFGLSVAEMIATPMSPTNFAYTRHLLHVSATDTLAALLAAILPCAWVYAWVGEQFTRRFGGPPPAGHPYADWIAMYSSPEFAEVGEWLRGRLNQRTAGLPEPELRRIEELFLISSRYEYMFWDMAWRRETWPV